MENLENLKKILEVHFDINTFVEVSELNLCGYGDLICANILAPGALEGVDKWVVRLAPTASFGEWSNTSYISDRFETVNGVEWALVDAKYGRCEIFERLFSLLSDDYEELAEDYRDLMEMKVPSMFNEEIDLYE